VFVLEAIHPHARIFIMLQNKENNGKSPKDWQKMLATLLSLSRKALSAKEHEPIEKAA
jgi:hypothetical protein